MSRIEQLLHFLSLDSQDAFTLYSLGYEYMLQQDWTQAIHWFEELRKLHPNYVGLYYHLGRCYEKAGQSEVGMNIFTTGLAIAEKIGETHAFAELKNTITNREMGLEDEE